MQVASLVVSSKFAAEFARIPLLESYRDFPYCQSATSAFTFTSVQKGMRLDFGRGDRKWIALRLRVLHAANGVGDGCFVAQFQQRLTDVSAWRRVCGPSFKSTSRWSSHVSRSSPRTLLAGRPAMRVFRGPTSKAANRVQLILRVVNVCFDRFFPIQSRNKTTNSPTVRPLLLLLASLSTTLLTCSVSSFFGFRVRHGIDIPEVGVAARLREPIDRLAYFFLAEFRLLGRVLSQSKGVKFSRRISS